MMFIPVRVQNEARVAARYHCFHVIEETLMYLSLQQGFTHPMTTRHERISNDTQLKINNGDPDYPRQHWLYEIASRSPFR